MSGAAWSRGFEEWLSAHAQERQLPGVSVLVRERGEEVYFHGFGHADREQGLPVTADTIFGIGSITKSFTALAVMSLVEDGRLDLTAPVTTYLPELERVFGERSGATTLHHFLTHTSGLPPLPVLFAALRRSMEADPDAAEDLRELDTTTPLPAIDSSMEHIDLLSRLPFPWLGAPGEHFSYSNDAYGLVGPIIERAAGMPYERFVEERILRPGGLQRSLFDARALSAMTDVAMSYMRRKPDQAPEGSAGAAALGPVVRSPVWWSAPAQTAAGFLKASARDLARYIELYQATGAIGGTRIVGAESVERMTTPVMTLAPAVGYGYGLVRSRYRHLDTVQHTGGLKAISAFAMTVPSEKLSVVVLINLGGEASQRVGMAVLNSLLGLDPEAQEALGPEAALPSERAPYTGSFYSGEEREAVEVRAEAGGLSLVADGQSRRLRPMGDGRFVVGEGAARTWMRALERDRGIFAWSIGSRIWPRRALWDATGYPTLRPAVRA